MNNDQFTPGPWIVSEQGEDDLIVVGAKGEFICSPSGSTFGQAINNSNLIASAPELLNGLRKTVGALNHLSRHIVPQSCTHALVCELEALIDKATNPQ